MKAEHPWPPLKANELLVPPLGCGAPIKDLERLWLECTCYYAVFDDNVMEDTHWDRLTRELWERQGELSPYFRNCVPLGCLESSTASGIEWEVGLPRVVVDGIINEGKARVAMWRHRVARLQPQKK